MGGSTFTYTWIYPRETGLVCISLSISYFSRKTTYLSILYITVHKSYFYRNKKVFLNKNKFN